MTIQSSLLSISELGKFANISKQTLRNKLHSNGYLTEDNKVGNTYKLTIEDASKFIAINYPILYNDFVNRYSDGKRNESIMFQIPKGKGVISAQKQRSGKTYYYIKDLPLYMDDKGSIVKYRSTGFTSKSDAEAARIQLISDRDNGLYKFHYLEVKHSESKNKNDSTNQSYYDFCVNYFQKAKYAEATRKLYLDITENRIKPDFKDIAISDLRKGLLQQFVDKYDRNIRKTFTVLSLTLKKLYSLDLIPTNYYKALIKPECISAKRPKVALTIEETKEFLNYYKGHHLEHCIRLLFQCGIRIGELLALQWDEIEFIDECKAKIHINTSWGETKKGMARKEPKTASSKRVIPINDSYTITILKKAKMASKGKLWVAENKTGLRPLDKHNFTKRYFTKVGKILGFTKHISSHVARHTFISHMVQKNVPYTEIAKLAGHENTTMIINVYAHAIQKESEVYDYVTNLFN